MAHSPSISHDDPSPWKISRVAVLVIVLGFIIRLYSLSSIPIFNPDGFLYIQQAKALYYKLFGSVLSCYEYLSNYPIFIAVSYKIFGDWVTAAQCVSLFFGTMTLIPSYWLVRRFFSETTSSIALLCLALIPPFILVSRDVLRGPVYWFFSMMGLYLFILTIEKRNRLYPLLSSICFIMGAWARIEGGLFIFVSLIFLLLNKHERRWQSLLYFTIPFILLCTIFGIFLYFADLDILPMLKLERIMTRPTNFFLKYGELRQNLKDLAETIPFDSSDYFLPKVRNLIWLIALGTLSVQIVETLFYIFFFILVVGIAASIRQIPKDSRLIYLSILSVSALIVLYSQIIFNWAMASRFTILFVFPAFVFMGAGIEKIAAFLSKRFNFKNAVSYAVICLIILIVALPKTLRANYAKDKLIYKEIGQFISKREKSRRVVSVACAFKRVRSVHFYANLHYRGAPCFDDKAILRQSDSSTLLFIRKRSYDYFIWDEKGWNQRGLNEFMKDPDQAFSKIRAWQSSKRGRLVLYEVRS